MADLPREAFQAGATALAITLVFSTVANTVTRLFGFDATSAIVFNNTLNGSSVKATLNATNTTLVDSECVSYWTWISIVVLILVALIAGLKQWTITITRNYVMKKQQKEAMRDQQGKLPLPEFIPMETPIFAPDGDGSNVKTMAFTSSLGSKIAVYNWAPITETKAVVLYIHGLDSSAQLELIHLPGMTYKGSTVEKFVNAGFSVWSMDNNGHGHSESVVEGVRGACMDFDDYVDDLVQFQELVAKNHPGLPFFLVGCSMGGTLTLRVSQVISSKITGSVAIASAVLFEKAKAKPINKILLPILGIMSRHFPLAALGEKDPHPDPRIREVMMSSGKFNTNRLRSRMATEFFRIADVIIDNVLEIKKPLLLIHAVGDTYVDFKGSELISNTALNANVEFLSECGTDWHDVLHDPKGLAVAGPKMIDFMNRLL